MKVLLAPVTCHLQQVGIPLQVAQVPLRVTLVQGLVSDLPRVFFVPGDIIAAHTHSILEREGRVLFPVAAEAAWLLTLGQHWAVAVCFQLQKTTIRGIC